MVGVKGAAGEAGRLILKTENSLEKRKKSKNMVLTCELLYCNRSSMIPSACTVFRVGLLSGCRHVSGGRSRLVIGGE